MSYKLIILVLVIISLILVATGYSLVYPEVVGLCARGDKDCIYSFPVFSVGEPLLFGFIPLTVILFLFLFLRPEVFYAWLKYFASWFVALSVLLIYLMPVDGGSSFFPGPDKESTTWTLSIIFLIISTVLIIVKSIKLRKKEGAGQGVV